MVGGKAGVSVLWSRALGTSTVTRVPSQNRSGTRSLSHGIYSSFTYYTYINMIMSIMMYYHRGMLILE